MNIPPSRHFVPLRLEASFNANRNELDGSLSPLQNEAYGEHSYLGIPFRMAEMGGDDVVLLEDNEVEIRVDDDFRATYVLFLHRVEDRPTTYLDGFADGESDGTELGLRVADYAVGYADGTKAETPILRRFAIQQAHIGWGASPFAAVPAIKASVFMGHSDEYGLGRMPATWFGQGETRVGSPRDGLPAHMWIYALPNPHPERPITSIFCRGVEERALIYAISHTRVEEHPLRPGVRRKIRVGLPEGVKLNELGELEGVEIDLGVVISCRAVMEYDESDWHAERIDVQPRRLQREVIIEYSAHPLANLYLPAKDGQPRVIDLAHPDDEAVEVRQADRPVRVRVVEKDSGRKVAVRLHMHGQHGEYLPPEGHHRRVNPHWFEDNYAEFVNGMNQYCYVDGECVAELPLGEVYVEIRRGYEFRPVRECVVVSSDTSELTFELERVLDWRASGWVTADTHVHFLSPHTALLEGQAEGVHVVNLLASQWGEMFSNVGDFDGRSTIGAPAFGGDGEFLVRVGTENRMQVLGHISLLGYGGKMIHPLCTGGPSESAVGDAQEVSMAQWATQCREQGGLVVMPHAPNPQCERAANIVSGLVDAVEMMVFNPQRDQINPYGLADWYRYLNLGYRIPLVGGSDKMDAASQLGGVRTYVQLGEREFTYENWMDAIKRGDTFVTIGPLARIEVEGKTPGDTIDLPRNGGTLEVNWRVESVSLPIDGVEVIVGGLVAEGVGFDKVLRAEGSARIPVSDSTWIALRVRGSYLGRHGEVAAHTSAVQVTVDGIPCFVRSDAMVILEQIEGAIAYVDTLAPRPDAIRYKKLRATLEAAHNTLHQQMHRNGVFHDHTPLHDHAHDHEH